MELFFQSAFKLFLDLGMLNTKIAVSSISLISHHLLKRKNTMGLF